jgi:hypothetical protein
MANKFQEYPKIMNHADHSPAKFKPLTDEEKNAKVPAFMKPVPQCIALERFPPVTVSNVEQEKEYASKGYRPNNIPDPAEYERALLESNNPDGYVFQAYPKWKYHPIEMARIVADAKEESALDEGWFDHPVEATEDDLPVKVVAKAEKKPQKKKTKKPAKVVVPPHTGVDRHGLGKKEPQKSV